MISLDQMHKGESAVIKGFKDQVLSKRLIELGCLPGETVRLLKFAPLGCPWAIEVSGTQLSIRKQEAASILVEV